MKEQKPSRKPLIYYGIIMFVVILLLNALVFPSLMEQQVREVGYNAFLAMLDSGAVKEVARDESEDRSHSWPPMKRARSAFIKPAFGRTIR